MWVALGWRSWLTLSNRVRRNATRYSTLFMGSSSESDGRVVSAYPESAIEQQWVTSAIASARATPMRWFAAHEGRPLGAPGAAAVLSRHRQGAEDHDGAPRRAAVA